MWNPHHLWVFYIFLQTFTPGYSSNLLCWGVPTTFLIFLTSGLLEIIDGWSSSVTQPTNPRFTQCRCFLVHAIQTNSTYPLGRLANQLSNSVACHTSAIKPNSWYKVGPPVMPIGSESPHEYYSYKHHEPYLLEVSSPT